MISVRVVVVVVVVGGGGILVRSSLRRLSPPRDATSAPVALTQAFPGLSIFRSESFPPFPPCRTCALLHRREKREESVIG